MDALHRERKETCALWGESGKMEDGCLVEPLSIACVKGTFVGRVEDGAPVFRGVSPGVARPLGGLRWELPVYVKPDERVFEARHSAKGSHGNESLERGPRYVQDEECPHINVRKSQEGPRDKGAAMAWIHGRILEVGGTIESPLNCRGFLKECPEGIAVTFAHRLGILDFGGRAYIAKAVRTHTG